MKILLLIFLPALLAGQSVSVALGGGAGAFNNTWKRTAASWSAGLLIDNQIGEHAGSVLGLHYRQRSDRATRLHTVQADFAGQYIGTRVRVGAGGFFAVGAGTESDAEPAQKLGSGVGVSAFVAYRVFRGLSVRLVYDHGLGNLAASGPSVTAQGAYLLIEYRLSE